MIHAVVLAEYHQTKRHILTAMLALFLIALALRMFLGLFGVVFALLALLPIACGSIGCGTFAEELSKGQLRFLYSMPVSRLSVWAIKCASGVLGMILFALSIGVALVLAGRRDGQELQAWEVLQSLDVRVFDAGLLYVAWSSYSFAAGVFCVMMCVSLQGETLLRACVSYLPLAVLWLAFRITGNVPPSHGMAFTLTAAAVGLLVGSFVLFNLRNPFLERKWLWRGVGMPFLGATTAVLYLGSAAALLWQGGASAPRFDRVIAAHPSPDGHRLMLITLDSPFMRHGYIVAADGTVEADLGPGVESLGGTALAWRPGTAETTVAYVQGGRSVLEVLRVREGKVEPQLALRNLPTGKEAYLSYFPHTDYERAGYGRYGQWSSDGQRLLGVTHDYSGDGPPSNSAFAQDIATGRVTETPLAEGYYSTVEFRADGRIVTGVSESEDWQCDKLLVIDPRSGTRNEWVLPSGVSSWTLLPESNSVVLVRDSIVDDSVGFEVLLNDMGTGAQEVLVERAALPEVRLEKALRDSVDCVGVQLSPSGRWLVCSIYDCADKQEPPTPDRSRLIHLPDRTTFSLPQPGTPDAIVQTVFSRDENKLLVNHFVYPDQENPAEEDGPHPNVTMQVVELSLAGARPVFSADVPASAWGFEWLDENRILYLRASGNADSHQEDLEESWMTRLTEALQALERELWMVDIEAGTHRPFPAARRADKSDAR